MSILTLKNVSYHYEKSTKEVLHQLQASFEKGILYTIVGKSGAGKSTLLSLLSGLDVATSGEVLYNGGSLKTLDRDYYRSHNIGVIFQGYNLLTNSTALDNVVLSMNISGNKGRDKKERAYRFLEQVGIDREKANRKVLKLSGGEQQRVGIARALSHHPDIIIADEPTGNLDYDTEQNIMEILQTLAHETNTCVIIVTHSANVSAYADVCFTLQKGNLTLLEKESN